MYRSSYDKVRSQQSFTPVTGTWSTRKTEDSRQTGRRL